MIQQLPYFGTDVDTDRGQVGIGTLIVFIALVLVAAIAAGVLINTAGFLQSQAESTGEESTDQVSNAIQVVGATGDVVDDGSGNGIVESPTVVLSLGPGADSVDLGTATYQLVGNGADTLSGSDVGTSGSEAITLTNVDGTAESLLDDSSDRIEAKIDLNSISNNDPLGNTASNPDEIELTITTSDGAQTTIVLSVPDYLDTDTSVEL